MNPVTAQMSPALLSIISGPAPTNGVFQDLLDISVPLADTLPQLPVKGAAPATAPICAATIPLAVPPLAEVQNGAATDVLPQAIAAETKRWTAAIILPQTTAPVAEKPATIIAVPEAKVPEVQTRTTAIFMPQAPVPEINIEDGEPVAAKKPDASLPQIDPQFVSLSVVQTPPSVSAPVKAALAQLAGAAPLLAPLARRRAAWTSSREQHDHSGPLPSSAANSSTLLCARYACYAPCAARTQAAQCNRTTQIIGRNAGPMAADRASRTRNTNGRSAGCAVGCRNHRPAQRRKQTAIAHPFAIAQSKHG